MEQTGSKPYIVITATRDGFGAFLQKILAYKALLYVLVLKDLKIRFQETRAGNIWFLMQPLINLLMFTIFLGYVARVNTQNIPYALFFLSGLVPVTFFNAVLLRMANSLLENSYIINKIYFPRTIIPLSTIGAICIDYLIMNALLLLLTLWYGYVPSPDSLIMIPMITLLLLLMAVGLGLAMSVLTVRYKDLRIILPFIAQMLVFVCPVIYPMALIPENYKPFYALNPLAVIVDQWRLHFFQFSELASDYLLSPIIAAFATCVFGLYYFYRHEKKIANYL